MYNITGYHEAHSLQEVFDLAKANSNIRLIAGGTDVLVRSRDEMPGFVDTVFVGISRIPDLQGIEMAADGTISIGAMNSFTTVEENPIVKEHLGMLSQAVSLVGGPQTRHMGTVGGNVSNAGTAADSAPSFFSYNTICEIHSAQGISNVPIKEIYAGPGKNNLKPGEVLVRFKIAKADYEGYVGHYTKFARRQALDIANLSCATLVKMGADDTIEDLRICFGAAAPTPVRTPKAEAYAKGKALTAETYAEIGKLCVEETSTIADWRASKAFRDHLVAILPGRNIDTALGKQTVGVDA